MLLNPSNTGWIEKLIKKVGFQDSFNFKNHHTFYRSVYESGYLYGYTQTIKVFIDIDISKLTAQEISKIYLFSCLVSVYKIDNQNVNFEDFITLINDFYKELIPKNQFLKKILPHEKSTNLLENYIDNRVKINENFINSFFSNVFTNSFLFLDVLAFKNFIVSKKVSISNLSKFEKNCMQLILTTLTFKKVKTNFDTLIIKTFENSLKYKKSDNNSKIMLENFDFDFFKHNLEKYFLMDILIFALWQEEKDNEIIEKIYFIANKLNLKHDYVDKNIFFVNEFIVKNKSKIPYFNTKNPLINLYNNSYSTVIRLITRNKSRIIKEIMQSKELLILILESSKRNLSEDEKKKMKKQILDICKVVPSLTIFLLPGGGLLLPILIKFIPQLLPSAFNENVE